MQRIMVLGAALALSGCLRQGTYTSARPLAKGHHEVAVRANGLAAATPDDATGLVQAAVRYRVGLTGDTDLGAGLGTDGLSLTLKHRVHDGPTQVSLAPEVAGLWVDGFRSVLAQVPVLFGWTSAGGHELTLGPRVGVWALGSDGFFGDGDATILTSGLSLGATVLLGHTVRLVPEINVTAPLVNVRGDGETAVNDSLVYLEGGLALVFEFGGSD